MCAILCMSASNTLILQIVLGQDSCPGQVRVGGATQEHGAALPSVSPVPHINLPVLAPWKLELTTNPREDLIYINNSVFSVQALVDTFNAEIVKSL